MKIGKFITIEGFFGAGKSCVLRKLKDHFKDAHFIREPGATFEGKEVRRIINSSIYKVESNTEDLLYLTSLIETSAKIVNPMLRIPKTVFSERWYYSVKANLFYPFGKDTRVFDKLLDKTEVAHPDINIIIHAPFDVCMKRLSKSRKNTKLLKRGENVLRSVYNYFYTECAGIQINSTRNITDVVSDIIMVVQYGTQE